MAAEKDVKRARPIAEASAEAPATTEKPVASELSLEELGLSKRGLNLLKDAGLQNAQDLLDALAQGEDELREIEGIGNKAMEEILERLAAVGLLEPAGSEVDANEEHQAIVEAEQITNEGAGASAQMREAIEEKPENTESPSTVQQERPQVLPTSFVVRLTVDEEGQVRTEIEHTKTDKKDTFPGLDGQRLVAFMEKRITPPDTVEPSITSEPLEIFDVRVTREESADATALKLDRHETFWVNLRFQLGGEGAPSVAAQESSYQVEVLASDVISGSSTLLTTKEGKLAREKLEYPVQFQASGLPAGLYRLLTLVKVQGETRMFGHHEGPVIRVA